MAEIIKATQTGRIPHWWNLHLPDAIRAHDRAIPHKFNQVKMPHWMKSWISRRIDNDAALMTGESAFQASSLMTGATWRLIRALEERVQVLEDKNHHLTNDLQGA